MNRKNLVAGIVVGIMTISSFVTVYAEDTKDELTRIRRH